MQPKIAGIALIVIGVIMIAYTGFNYVTTEKVVDLGLVKINREKNHPVRWSPIVGAVLLVGGIVTVVRTKKVTSYLKSRFFASLVLPIFIVSL